MPTSRQIPLPRESARLWPTARRASNFTVPFDFGENSNVTALVGQWPRPPKSACLPSILPPGAMCRIPDFGQSWRLLPVLLRTRRRRAASDNISAFATPNGNPKDKTRGHKADGEKVRHGRGHYYDLYSICDTIGCRVPGRVCCALRLQFLDLRLPHSYSIVTLLFGLIVHIQLFA